MKLRDLFLCEKYSGELKNEIFVQKSFCVMIKGLSSPLLNEEIIEENLSKYIDQIENILICKNTNGEAINIKGNAINVGLGSVGLVICQLRRNPRHLPRIMFFTNGKLIDNVVLSIIPLKDQIENSKNLNIENSIQTFLASIRSNKYETIQEKIEILGKIDEIIRDLFLKKYPDIKKRPLYSEIACCSEFCPEREKYIKISNGQLSLYEKAQGYPNLSLMDEEALIIKDYTRSAADQNIPLPYEIRTLSTLTLLMNHICQNILANSSSSLTPQWFSFVYDCTRSMRKELAQLNILNFESIKLLEQMARFHLFCIPFQSKISTDPTNRDNSLGLQHSFGMLRDFYLGVALTHELSDIENYGEFCAYQILLSFNDSLDLQNAVAMFDPFYDRRVIHALKIRRAYDERNFFLFFKYLQQADCLTAAIMFSHIMNLRTKSLRVILNAFSAQKAQTQPFQLRLLVDFLKFSHEEQLNAFITELEGSFIDEDNVTFPNKSNLGCQAFTNFKILPEEPLVEERMSLNICDVVCQGDLINNICFPIQKKSFDINGRYSGSHFDVLFGQPDRNLPSQVSNSNEKEIIITSEKTEKKSIITPKLELNSWPFLQPTPFPPQTNTQPIITKLTSTITTPPAQQNQFSAFQIPSTNLPLFSPIYSHPSPPITYSLASTPFTTSNSISPSMPETSTFQNIFQTSVSWPQQKSILQNPDISSFIKYSELYLPKTSSPKNQQNLFKGRPNIEKTAEIILEKIIREYLRDKSLKIVSKLEKAANLKIKEILSDTYNQFVLKRFLILWSDFTRLMKSQNANPRYNILRKRICENPHDDVLTKRISSAYDSMLQENEKYWWADFLITKSDLINTYLCCLDNPDLIPPNTIKFAKFVFIFPDDIGKLSLSYGKNKNTFALMIWVKLFHLGIPLTVDDIKGTTFDSRVLYLSKNGFQISILSLLESSIISMDPDTRSAIYGCSGLVFCTYNSMEIAHNHSIRILDKLNSLGLLLPSIYLHHIHLSLCTTPLSSKYADSHTKVLIDSTPKQVDTILTKLFNQMIERRPLIPYSICVSLNSYINPSICNELIYICIRLPECAYLSDNIKKTSILMTNLINGYFENIQGALNDPFYKLPLPKSTVVDIDGIPCLNFRESTILSQAVEYISMLFLPNVPSILVFDGIKDACTTIMEYIETYLAKPQIQYTDHLRDHLLQKCIIYGIRRQFGKFYIILGQIIKIVLPTMINLLFTNNLSDILIWIPISKQNLGQTIQFDFPQYFELDEHISLISQQLTPIQENSTPLPIDSSFSTHLSFIKKELLLVNKRQRKRQSI